MHRRLPSPDTDSVEKRLPCVALRGWIITDGKIGMDVQCRGVADALGLDYEVKHVTPSGMRGLLAPWSWPSPRERLGAPGSLLAPPWPDIAIATGRQSIPYLRKLSRLAGHATYYVVLQDPKMGAAIADLVWVPQHDRLIGPNVIRTLTAPHSYSPARLALLRERVPEAIAALPRPRIAVIVGGPSGAYKFTTADGASLAQSLRALAGLGASFLITPSRRTPPAVLGLVDAATRDCPRILWNGEAPNPYPDFLAHADYLVVTGDSVNMTGEACATGRPVYVFEPVGGSAKFRRFHAALRQHGATRRLPAAPTHLESWHYEPLDSACQIASEIERRIALRRRHLPAGGRFLHA